MLLRSLIYTLLMLVTPQMSANWAGSRHDGLRISAGGLENAFSECAHSGLEVRLQYEVRLCGPRRFWLDDCSSIKVEKHSMQFDPISELYKVKIDRLGDNEGPRIEHYSSESQAFRKISTIENLPLSFLDDKGKVSASTKRLYVGARVLSECRGEYSQLMEKFSYYLSLGMIRASGFDSHWVDFYLDQ